MWFKARGNKKSPSAQLAILKAIKNEIMFGAKMRVDIVVKYNKTNTRATVIYSSRDL